MKLDSETEESFSSSDAEPNDNLIEDLSSEMEMEDATMHDSDNQNSSIELVEEERTEDEASKEDPCDVDRLLKDLLDILKREAKRLEAVEEDHDMSDDEEKMDVDEEEEPQQDAVEPLNHDALLDMWKKLEEALKTAKPVMSSDPTVVDLLSSMKGSIISEKCLSSLEEVQGLVENITKVLKTLRPVDLEMLGQLLQKNKNAGDAMEDKDVVVLLGGTGAGKTTTVQFLAGVTFEEVEIDGCFHLAPKTFPDPKLKEFHTSCGSSSVTRSVQCFDVSLDDGSSIVLCDVPGFGDTGGTEIEIANGVGVVRAIQRAKTARIALLLSEKGIGDRFDAVSSILKTIIQLFGGHLSDSDVAAFGYLFTKYEAKYKTLLWKQSHAKKRDSKVKDNDQTFVLLLDDIIKKNRPEANIVCPLADNGSEVLKKLLLQNGSHALDPRESFHTFVSEMASKDLQLQLQYTLSNFDDALQNERFYFAKHQLESLHALLWLNGVKDTYERAHKHAVQSLKNCSTRIDECVKRFEKVVVHETFSTDLQLLYKDLLVLKKQDTLRQLCLPEEPSADSLHAEYLHKLGSAVGKKTLKFVAEKSDPETSLWVIEHFLEEIGRLRELHEMFTTQATQVVYFACVEKLLKFSERLLIAFESFNSELPGNLSGLANLNRIYDGLGCLFDKLDDPTSCVESRSRVKCLRHRRKDELRKLERTVSIAYSEAVEVIESARQAVTAMERDDTDCIPQQVDISKLKTPRELLVQISTIPLFRDSLYAKEARDVCQFTRSLDLHVLKYFESYRTFCRTSLRRIKENESESNDVHLARASIENLVSLNLLVKEQFDKYRSWSPDHDDAAADLANEFVEIQQKTHRYKELLDERLEESRKDISEVCGQAKGFLERLVTDNAWTSVMLRELSTKWQSWDATRKKILRQSKTEKKNRWWTSKAVAFVSSSFSSDPTAGFQHPLLQHMFQIEERVGKALSKAAGEVRVLEDSRLQLHALARLLFNKLSRQVLLCGEAIKLWSEQCLLIASVLKASQDLAEAISMAETSLAIGLSSFTSACMFAVKEKRFLDISRELSTLQKSNDVMKSLQSWSKIQGLMRQKIANRHGFVHAVNDCPTYASLRLQAMKAVNHIETEVNKLSLLREPKIHTVNETDRLDFYSGLLEHLKMAKAAARDLAKHVSDEQALRLDQLHAKLAPVLHREIESISEHLFSMLSEFPSNVSDFQEIYIWQGNLEAIYAVFRDKEIEMAAHAKRSIDEANRKLRNRLDATALPSNINEETIVSVLIQLKSSSNGICCWRSLINERIDAILLEAPKKSANPGTYVLDLFVKLKEVADEKAPIAQQILSEHDCFEGAMNAVFNSTTARQGIGYVLDDLNLSSNDVCGMKKMYEIFDHEYREIVRRGILVFRGAQQSELQEYLIVTADEAKALAGDFSIAYDAQLVSLTARLFAYWSLKSINCFVVEDGHSQGKNADNSNDCSSYLKKPHAAQVVSVWLLLNAQHADCLRLENHLVELKTGEGKSIVLGVTATILAMLGADVTCICYSDYLSKRDYSDFADMFSDFGALETIKYGTINNLCEGIALGESNVRNLAENFILRNGNPEDPIKGSHMDDELKIKVLLVDEADVFFKDDFFGKLWYPIVPVSNTCISALFHYVWDHCRLLSADSLLQSSRARDVLRHFAVDVHKLIENEILGMLAGAKAIVSGSNIPYLVVDNSIAYKHFDGTTSSTFHGYETRFAYMKEHDAGRITTAKMEQNLCIAPFCASLSYAEIPLAFDALLGVTGTLKGLGEAETKTLEDKYQIHRFSYIPSVYGKNKLQFAGNNPHDVILCDSKDGHFLEIRNEIDKRRKPLNGTMRPVMVFFGSKKDLLDFYDSEQMTGLRKDARTITEEVAPRDKAGAFLKATEAGAVSLLIRDYGRGTDFKCFDSKVLDAGGVHVIQAFFASDLAEEIQIKGRTARQGAKGSFSMVLKTEDLKHDFGVQNTDIERMKRKSDFYTILDEHRCAALKQRFLSSCNKIEEAEQKHYQSLDFIDAAKSNNRSEAVRILLAMNNLESGPGNRTSVGQHISLKAKKLEKRRERLKAYEHNDRDERRKAREDFRSFTRAEEETKGDETCDKPLLLKGVDDLSFYELLDIPRNASKKDIEASYRRLAVKYHPDKSKDQNSTALFIRIKHAKEVLTCDSKRAAYDVKLNRSG